MSNECTTPRRRASVENSDKKRAHQAFDEKKVFPLELPFCDTNVGAKDNSYPPSRLKATSSNDDRATAY